MPRLHTLNFLRTLLLACSLILPRLAPAADLDLDALMRTLGQVKSGEAQFTEERQVFQLDQILRSSGRLSFSAPDTFVRETLRPRRERMAVVGNQLTLSQGSRTRTTTLDSIPEATIVVEAIRGTLTGDRATLERYFSTRLRGSEGAWQLDLVPRDARLRSQVLEVRILGRQGQVREVHMELAGGDRTLMRIEPVAASGATSR